MDKLAQFKGAHQKKQAPRRRMKGVFHTWNTGDNHIRLVSTPEVKFLETRTHFIAPAAERGDRGLCRSDAFAGDAKIPQVINCTNWDVETETTKVGGCPICKLNSLAWDTLKKSGDTLTDKEKKFYNALKLASRPRTLLKWNIIDRKDPYVMAVDDDGKETKELGFKIASIGMEAWSDIESIFAQMGDMDISDVEEGVDIVVNKGHDGTRVKYTAAVAMDTTKRPPTVKVTPLTAAERACEMHNLVEVCGRYTDNGKIMDALHDDYRSLLGDASTAVDAGDDDVPFSTEGIATEGDVLGDILDEDEMFPATPTKAPSKNR
jgi:hypothetical protein